MKWSKIRQLYPDKFILLGDLVEERISETKYQIISGSILKVSDDNKEIRKAYKEYKRKGTNVLYSLPSTPKEFIVENVPFKGIAK